MAHEAAAGTVPFALAWAVFRTTHSLLARDAPKRVLRRHWGHASRLGWNPIAIARFGLVPVVGRTLLPHISWPHSPAVVLVQLLTGGIGTAILLASGWSYNMRRYAGITQLRSVGEDGDEPFSARGPLAYIRHPLYIGSILIVLALACDVRSAETAVFATLYIVIGLRFEEAALVRRLGPIYAAYRSRVSALLP
jgi:protein-S-isoprenylcysteine O-methyltransferase Ste14